MLFTYIIVYTLVSAVASLIIYLHIAMQRAKHSNITVGGEGGANPGSGLSLLQIFGAFMFIGLLLLALYFMYGMGPSPNETRDGIQRVLFNQNANNDTYKLDWETTEVSIASQAVQTTNSDRSIDDLNFEAEIERAEARVAAVGQLKEALRPHLQSQERVLEPSQNETSRTQTQSDAFMAHHQPNESKHGVWIVVLRSSNRNEIVEEKAYWRDLLEFRTKSRNGKTEVQLGPFSNRMEARRAIRNYSISYVELIQD